MTKEQAEIAASFVAGFILLALLAVATDRVERLPVAAAVGGLSSAAWWLFLRGRGHV